MLIIKRKTLKFRDRRLKFLNAYINMIYLYKVYIAFSLDQNAWVLIRLIQIDDMDIVITIVIDKMHCLKTWVVKLQPFCSESLRVNREET